MLKSFWPQKRLKSLVKFWEVGQTELFKLFVCVYSNTYLDLVSGSIFAAFILGAVGEVSADLFLVTLLQHKGEKKKKKHKMEQIPY